MPAKRNGLCGHNAGTATFYTSARNVLFAGLALLLYAALALSAADRATAQQRVVGWPVLSGAGHVVEDDEVVPAALYPTDQRRPMVSADYMRFPGAGILFCRGDDNIPQRAAASWLIGSRSLVMMNAHNFRDHRAEITRSIEGCYFQIGGKNYLFDSDSLEFGFARGATALHITDDWALVRLRKPVEAGVQPQPIPEAPIGLHTGQETIPVTMVSPAGHGNWRAFSSLENCAIKAIDPPTEDGIRRARHNCNDGFGGSGSGLFDEGGHLVAMQSASLDMNRRLPFDLNTHYGSALLIEGKLLEAIRREVEEIH